MYAEVVTFHIIFAGIWLAFFIVELTLRKQIIKNNSKEKISVYLNFSNTFGIIGSIGILVTGIVIVMMNGNYGFFDMSGNHWLATKQIIIVIILILTGAILIPNAKKARTMINQNKSNEEVKELAKVFMANQIINYLVLLNFLFAITHRLYS